MSIDISRRTALVERVTSDPRVLQPLIVTEGLRPDQIADAYYSSPKYTWIVYTSAGIIDPFYDWNLSEDMLAALAVEKFGSIEEAQQRVRFYRLGWADNPDHQVSVSYYADNLTEDLKKYYEPILGENFATVAYQLRREDWTAATNRIVGVTVSGMSNTSFTVDERLTIKTGNTVTGNAAVSYVANTTYMLIKHVAGNTSTPNTVITGVTSGATATLVLSTTLTENIAADEESYWTPVYEWDYMYEINQNKRNIRLLDSRFVGETQREFEKLIKE